MKPFRPRVTGHNGAVADFVGAIEARIRQQEQPRSAIINYLFREGAIAWLHQNRDRITPEEMSALAKMLDVRCPVHGLAAQPQTPCGSTADPPVSKLKAGLADVEKLDSADFFNL